MNEPLPMKTPPPECKTCKGDGMLVVVQARNRYKTLYTEMCRACGGGRYNNAGRIPSPAPRLEKIHENGHPEADRIR